ncbi:MAG: hypothetical protein ACI9RY_001222, partial [Reinekea sp.]
QPFNPQWACDAVEPPSGRLEPSVNTIWRAGFQQAFSI